MSNINGINITNDTSDIDYMKTMKCPCLSDRLYAECCGVFHQRQEQVFSKTAEQLMRSRYSAFVLADVDYIVQTTLPSLQNLLDKESIEDWAITTDWAGLEVVGHKSKLGKRHAQVEFKAFYNDKHDQSHFFEELSTFVNIADNSSLTDGHWYFIDPNALEKMTITQKQLCICGSGDKFKHCCGKYL